MRLIDFLYLSNIKSKFLFILHMFSINNIFLYSVYEYISKHPLEIGISKIFSITQTYLADFLLGIPRLAGNATNQCIHCQHALCYSEQLLASIKLE